MCAPSNPPSLDWIKGSKLRLTTVLWPLRLPSPCCGTSASAPGSLPLPTVSFHALWHRAFPWTWHQNQRWQAACHQEPKDRIPCLRDARKTESWASLGSKPPHRFLLKLGTNFLSCEGMSTHLFRPEVTILTVLWESRLAAHSPPLHGFIKHSRSSHSHNPLPRIMTDQHKVCIHLHQTIRKQPESSSPCFRNTARSQRRVVDERSKHKFQMLINAICD